MRWYELVWCHEVKCGAGYQSVSVPSYFSVQLVPSIVWESTEANVKVSRTNPCIVGASFSVVLLMLLLLAFLVAPRTGSAVDEWISHCLTFQVRVQKSAWQLAWLLLVFWMAWREQWWVFDAHYVRSTHRLVLSADMFFDVNVPPDCCTPF